MYITINDCRRSCFWRRLYLWLKKLLIFRNYFTKTDRLSAVFGKNDHYSLPTDCRWKIWWVENHLRGFHRNSSTVARKRAGCARTFNSGILMSVYLYLALFHPIYGRLAVGSGMLAKSISLQDFGRVHEANTWLGSAKVVTGGEVCADFEQTVVLRPLEESTAGQHYIRLKDMLWACDLWYRALVEHIHYFEHYLNDWCFSRY